MKQIPFVHILYSGKLYGTERMTINLAQGLSAEYASIILAPGGLVLAEATIHDITAKCFGNFWDLVGYLKSYLSQYQQLIFVTTTVSQSILVLLGNLIYRRQIIHLHLVHGGTEEKLSYGRKSLLNRLPVQLIAVSDYVRERLEVHGVNPTKIKVIENFLLTSEVEKIPKRQPFDQPGITQIIIVSRLDPIKRIDLLFDTLDACPELASLKFWIFGLGRDLEQLQIKAQAKYPQVILKGFSQEIFQGMANSDLLLHLCPVEPFGLVILEAMAVGIPVLVPDQGGTKTLVKNEITGFQFKANDPQDLARCLLRLQHTSPDLLNYVVKNAQKNLKSEYSELKGIKAYRELLAFSF
jgi:glycosyltransferase involved in cell wall biosynthesis